MLRAWIMGIDKAPCCLMNGLAIRVDVEDE